MDRKHRHALEIFMKFWIKPRVWKDVSINTNFHLKNFLDEFNGVDIGFCGNTFTWCNRKGGMANIIERSNIVITSVDWRTTSSNAGVIHLNVVHSNHVTILLNLFLDHPKLPRPFRFQKIWLREPLCFDIVRRAWECNTS